MNVFIQGMRRNGTTILFDLFCEDGSFDCWYEPLAAAIKPVIGGGSGEREIDYFAKVRALRTRILANRADLPGPEVFNYGAPRYPSLEFETQVPPYIIEYLKLICAQADDTVIKFTRMYQKVSVLHAIDPQARFIHIVRDPRAVAASYLFGKNQRNRHRFPDEEAFFTHTTERISWNAHAFAEQIIERAGKRHWHNLPNFMRVMLVWKQCFESTWRDGRAMFGDRYFLMRHEDLLCDPVSGIKCIYAFLDRSAPESVCTWAMQRINRRFEVFAHHNPAWRRAVDILELHCALEITGYKFS